MFPLFFICKVDRRAHHNALERRRRHHIKDSFATLRAMLPTSMEPRVSCFRLLSALLYIKNLCRLPARPF
ncbi:HLH domain containing protein [Trichuris trichiura]|uniref:HLH domain containing protein n=1 Tax=Trichuris trichiura TaxID=36087 RepID=A0A077YUV4_TRITR|nr:HLH domain containing protein [Trichuris trichiura]